MGATFAHSKSHGTSDECFQLFNDAPVHSSRAAQQKLTQLRFELLPYPAYLPDLASLDFNVFGKFKTFLTEYKFVCNEEAIQALQNSDCLSHQTKLLIEPPSWLQKISQERVHTQA